jgi:intracellular multiplication protein IcmK
MNYKITFLAAIVGLICQPVSAADPDPSSGNVSIVASIDPTNASVPFPDNGSAASGATGSDAAQMRNKLNTAPSGGSAESRRFPDQTDYEPTQGNSAAARNTSTSRGNRSGNQQEMMTTKQALMEGIRPGNLTPEDIREALSARDEISASMNTPVINSVPQITSQTISLSPGDATPVVRVAPGRPTYIVFEDITGAPWPLEYPPINHSGSKRFYVSGFTDKPFVTIQPLVTYGNGDIGVILKNLPVPISLVLANAEPTAADKVYKYDSRVNIRIPRRGPLASQNTITTVNKIALTDPELQSLLDGIPPKDATRLNTDNKRVSVWRRADKLYVRSAMESRTQFSKTLSSADGTHVYEMEISPFITMMEQGSTITVKVEL